MDKQDIVEKIVIWSWAVVWRFFFLGVSAYAMMIAVACDMDARTGARYQGITFFVICLTAVAIHILKKVYKARAGEGSK